VSWEWKFAGG